MITSALGGTTAGSLAGGIVAGGVAGTTSAPPPPRVGAAAASASAQAPPLAAPAIRDPWVPLLMATRGSPATRAAAPRGPPALR